MKSINIAILTIVVVFTTLLFSSCQKTIDVGATSAVKVANQWWCHILDADGNALTGYAPFTTYNTSVNKDSFWVDDNQNLYGFKVKARFNSEGAFETGNSANEYYDPSEPDQFPKSVIISDGTVLTDAAKSKTGVTVDSIYMKIQFSDDPGTTYIIAGEAKTGWDADDY